jgi:hypothetical protein
LALRTAKRIARKGLEVVSAVRPVHWDALRVERTALSAGAFGDRQLDAAISWIRNAQDSTGSGGVAWGYRARALVRSGDQVGWQPAYPETSGYILETLLRYGEKRNDVDALQRAKRIADWEADIQLPDGGIQGGVIGASPVEASTFVTGQVLFGFVRAYEKFGNSAYKQAGIRAADFLMACLAEDGRFVKGHSHFCAKGEKCYEVRTGWAMTLAGKVFGVSEYMEGGRRTAEFAVRCQNPNGWYRQNDLDKHDKPLTHTIGYTVEGLYENGVLLNEPRYFEAVRTTLLQIKRLVGESGYLAGRWRENWTPAVDWCCLTGSAQIACVCFRMSRHYPQDGFDQLGKKLLKYVASTQLLEDRSPGLAGGIHGSYPFSGDYGQYCNLNWAAKFYCDALMDRVDLKV